MLNSVGLVFCRVPVCHPKKIVKPSASLISSSPMKGCEILELFENATLRVICWPVVILVMWLPSKSRTITPRGAGSTTIEMGMIARANNNSNATLNISSKVGGQMYFFNFAWACWRSGSRYSTYSYLLAPCQLFLQSPCSRPNVFWICIVTYVMSTVTCGGNARTSDATERIKHDISFEWIKLNAPTR